MAAMSADRTVGWRVVWMVEHLVAPKAALLGKTQVVPKVDPKVGSSVATMVQRLALLSSAEKERETAERTAVQRVDQMAEMTVLQ